jgi:hypothetical protein
MWLCDADEKAGTDSEEVRIQLQASRFKLQAGKPNVIKY